MLNPIRPPTTAIPSDAARRHLVKHTHPANAQSDARWQQLGTRTAISARATRPVIQLQRGVLTAPPIAFNPTIGTLSGKNSDTLPRSENSAPKQPKSNLF